jgi:hypothetical protein
MGEKEEDHVLLGGSQKWLKNVFKYIYVNMVIKNRKKTHLCNHWLFINKTNVGQAYIYILLITINSKFQNISKSKNHQF